MNKLVSFIEKYKQENPTGWRKWIIGGLVAIATVLVLAVYYIQATFQGKALAKLQTERDVAEEAAHQALFNQELAEDVAEKERHEAVAAEAIERAKTIDSQIKVIEETHAAREAAINNIKSWDDVDKRVK